MIMEALSLIPLEPSTPLKFVYSNPMVGLADVDSIIGMTPIVATFILFDLIVYNPDHSETPKNMLYLDIAAGYLQRVHIAAGGCSQRGHLLAELTVIAREFINRKQHGSTRSDVHVGTQMEDGTTSKQGVASERNHGYDDFEFQGSRIPAPDMVSPPNTLFSLR